MPHQCTTCDRTFADGSKQMLSGCPDCGGNKFRYVPDGAEGETAADPPDPPEPPGDRGTVAETVRGAATTVRDLVGNDDPPERPGERPGSPTGSPGSTPTGAGSDSGSRPTGSGVDPASEPGVDPATESTTDSGVDPATDADPGTDDADGSGPEDAAQASARSSVVDPDEIPGEAGANGATTGTATAADGDDAPADDDGPDLSELRQELNDQFESIRIVEPGQYELNLMELYDRDEYIISLMEDGRYAIEVPETWRGDRT